MSTSNTKFLKSHAKALKKQQRKEIDLDDFFTHLKNLDNEKLVLQITKTLNEPKSYVMTQVVKYLDRSLIFELLQKTIEIQQKGGMSTQGPVLKNKTPGGVFFTLMKKSVPKDLIKQIFKVEDLKQKDKRMMIKLTNIMHLSCKNPEQQPQPQDDGFKISHKEQKKQIV